MIAILGATGTIGLSLARLLSRDSSRSLALFARNPQRLAGEPWGANVDLRDLDNFNASEFQLTVNAIGAGDPTRVKAIGATILSLTEMWDRRVLGTMNANSRYVFISSGAVHGANTGSAPHYTLAKLKAEARHRLTKNRSIVDIRVFGYADIALPLNGGFFLTDLACSVVNRRPLVTSPRDMVRDYTGAPELADLIRCWKGAGAPNAALDLYSKSPIGKSELLRMAQNRYGVDIQFQDDIDEGPTGAKLTYASTDRTAETMGYAPKRTAAEAVMDYLDAVKTAGG